MANSALTDSVSPPDAGGVDGARHVGWLSASARLIAWLGVSTAGLGVFLTAVGYLALTGHNSALGIPTSLALQTEFIVAGALFFHRSLMLGVAALLDGPAVGGITALAVALWALRRWWSERLEGLGRKIEPRADFILIVGCLAALSWLTEPLAFHDLLYETTLEELEGTARAIVGRDTEPLLATYGRMVVLTAALGWLALRRERVATADTARNRITPLRVLARGLFGLVLVLLPGVYGVLTIRSAYPVVSEISMDAPSVTGLPLDEAAEGGESGTFLLRHDSEELLLYDQTSHRVLRIPVSRVSAYMLAKPRSVFEKAKGE